MVNAYALPSFGVTTQTADGSLIVTRWLEVCHCPWLGRLFAPEIDILAPCPVGVTSPCALTLKPCVEFGISFSCRVRESEERGGQAAYEGRNHPSTSVRQRGPPA